jgi:hypothetical protein
MIDLSKEKKRPTTTGIANAVLCFKLIVSGI